MLLIIISGFSSVVYILVCVEREASVFFALYINVSACVCVCVCVFCVRVQFSCSFFVSVSLCVCVLLTSITMWNLI